MFCRQGVLPFEKFWASTRPFNTPIGPYILKWGLTLLMILAPPAGDAFSFVVDLSIYPAQAFALAMAAGLFLVRYQRTKVGLGRSDFRAWDIALIFNILVNLYCLIMPWYPPPGGANHGQFTFWYASYVVTGIGM
jgi:Amino acid permease